MKFKTNTIEILQSDNNEVFERSEIIANIFDLIESPEENCMIIYGQRCIGKTTLLKCIEKKLLQHKKYIGIYFDLNNKSSLSVEQLLFQLADLMSEQLNAAHFDMNLDILTGFHEIFIPNILDQLYPEHSLVFIIDEFDTFSDSDHKKQIFVFFEYIKYLLKIFKLRINFIIAIGKQPEDLYNIYMAHFKGKRFQRLSLFTHKETSLMVKQIERNNVIKWPERIVNQIHNISSGHPILIVYLCKAMRNKSYGESPESSIDDAISDGNDFLEWLWKGLNSHCQIITSIISTCKNEIVTYEDIQKLSYEYGLSHIYNNHIEKINLLIEYDIIKQHENGFYVVIKMFRTWIKKHKPPGILKDNDNQRISISGNLYKAAHSLYKTGQIDHSLKICEQLVLIEPYHIEANLLLADVLLDKNELYKAKKLLVNIYKKNPTAAYSRFLKILILESNVLENLYSYDFNTYLYSAKNNHYLDLCRLRFANISDQENHLLTVYEKILELDPDKDEVIDKYERLIVRKQNCTSIIKRLSYENDVLLKELEAYTTTNAKKKIYEIQTKLQFNNRYIKALKVLKKDEIEKARDLLKRVLYLKPLFLEARRFLFIVNNNKSISDIKNHDNKESNIKNPEYETKNQNPVFNSELTKNQSPDINNIKELDAINKDFFTKTLKGNKWFFGIVFFILTICLFYLKL